MVAVAFGSTAALLWGFGTLALRPGARELGPSRFAFWFAAFNALLLLPVAAIVIARSGLSWAGVGVGVGAGVAQATATLLYGRALAVGDMVVVAPLVALEGAFAALIGILTGDPVNAVVAGGLVLVASGGILLGMSGRGTFPSTGAALAVLTALFFGVVLWILGSGSESSFVLLFLLNLVAAAIIGARTGAPLRAAGLSRRGGLLLAVSAAFNVGGLIAYTAGARGHSLPVTAVLAAQFAIVAVAGGYLVHDERLSPRQLAGLAGVLAGVSILALRG
jgi:drug/metabolite transporter (DMT)-like permease